MPALLLLVAALVLLTGCHSAAPLAQSGVELGEGIEHLRRPLPGDLAALYRLRVPSTGGLKVAVLAAGGAGRMTISQPFGGAVQVSSWSADGRAQIFDLEQGCRYDAENVASVFGVGLLPFERAARLLGGRLPWVVGDRIRVIGHRVRVDGSNWSCLATIQPEPWRVAAVESVDESTEGGWRVTLGEHTSSVPGRLRVDSGDGRWAELRLVKLEWGAGTVLPAAPDLEPCGGGRVGR